jgi:BirA family biotin operon repressor/biotin-[acetyl-CoA-carboxylase] ligase
MSIDEEILRALRAAGTGAVSGADLSHKIGISRTAIWARIEDLRALGYEIEARPHLGYRLLSVPDVLHADDLLSQLGGTRVIGREIRVFHETTSTNDIIERLARDGVKEGVVVFAESQTEGRGRLGRRWLSPVGKGLWFSVLLRPGLSPQQVTQLTVACGTALRRAIHEQTGLRVAIKWPNDILVGRRKLAGILTEMRGEPERVKYVIIGIGVDVNVDLDDFDETLRSQVTSIKHELRRPVSRAELAVCMLRELDHEYSRVVRGEFASVAEEWMSHCSTIGEKVRITIGNRVIHGRAESLDDSGALLVRTEHGRLEPILGGDVTVEK